jgi:uncharacterized protein
MRRGILLIFAFAVARLEAQQPDTEESATPSQIRTSATATRAVPPDLAIATFEFSARGRTAAEAARAAQTSRRAIREALTKAGVPDDSILTPGFDSRRGEENFTMEVKPNSEFRTYDTTYVFRDRLVARMRNLQRLGSAIDAALAAGAEKISSLQFSTSRSAKARQDALSEASRQARRNAELMADAAGGKLGRLLDLSTDADRYPEALSEVQAANLVVNGASPVGATIKPTNIETQVSVYGRWEFVPVPKSAPGP